MHHYQYIFTLFEAGERGEKYKLQIIQDKTVIGEIHFGQIDINKLALLE